MATHFYYCGFINLCWTSVFVDFIVQSIHEIVHEFMYPWKWNWNFPRKLVPPNIDETSVLLLSYTVTFPQDIFLKLIKPFSDWLRVHWERQEVGEGFFPSYGVHDHINPRLGRYYALPLRSSDHWIKQTVSVFQSFLFQDIS